VLTLGCACQPEGGECPDRTKDVRGNHGHDLAGLRVWPEELEARAMGDDDFLLSSTRKIAHNSLKRSCGRLERKIVEVHGDRLWQTILSSAQQLLSSVWQHPPKLCIELYIYTTFSLQMSNDSLRLVRFLKVLDLLRSKDNIRTRCEDSINGRTYT
jgi:hypothetical protein